MTEAALNRRPVPHINHTPELEAAAIAVTNAKSRATTHLNMNPLDVHQVRESLKGVAKWFEDPSFYFPDAPSAELAAVENLVLLSTLLREHLKAGNT